ncbi:hypothetical protein LguiA_021029 [Lonicera macranthoides]
MPDRNKAKANSWIRPNPNFSHANAIDTSITRHEVVYRIANYILNLNFHLLLKCSVAILFDVQQKRDTSETDIIIVVEQRMWHSMEEGQFVNLQERAKPWTLVQIVTLKTPYRAFYRGTNASLSGMN